MEVTRRSLIAAAGGAAVLAGCGKKQPAEPRPRTARAPDLKTWEGVRAAFDLDPAVRDFAAFYLAAHPLPVREAIARHRIGLDRGPRRYMGEHEVELDEAAVDAAAGHLGASVDDVALTGSTTEGLGLFYGGLRLRAGDEVLTTEHDFYATHEALRVAAQRTDARVRRVTLYDDPARADGAAIARALGDAVTRRTRAVAITWVHSSTGVKLPLAEIARAVHAANPRTLVCVDGVHGFGAEPAGVEALGCDVLVSGCHKWLAGPRGTGLVWASRRAWREVDPLVPSFAGEPYGAWLEGRAPEPDPPGPLHTPGGFHAFEHRWALAQAFEFQAAIGQDRIAERIHALARRLKAGLAALPNVTVVTPGADDLSAGLVCFDIRGREADAIAETLGSRHRIVASVTPYATRHVRLGVGIHLSEGDVDAAVAAVAKI